MKFRKKPVVIEAIKVRDATEQELIDFMGGEEQRNLTFSYNRRSNEVTITTLEGTMRANADDWIIRGVQGEFYPCKPDIFAATYEPA